MSSSLTGKPPQDLSLTNLAVKDTLVATSVTAVNVNATTINGLSTATTVQPIRSVFTGAQVGQWSVENGFETFNIAGELYDNPDPLPAGTVVAQIDNYRPQSLVSFPAYVYCPAAPTIAAAGFLATTIVNEDGTITSDAPIHRADQWTSNFRVVPKWKDY